MTIEEQFAGLIRHLREQGQNDLPRILTRLEPDDIPEEFRSAFGFWRSLSGSSRNFMLDTACGRRTRRTHARTRRGTPFRREI
jgi:hypothetical protein